MNSPKHHLRRAWPLPEITLPLALLVVMIGLPPRRSAAGTAIVANRTRDTIQFAVADREGRWRKLTLKPRQLVPIPVAAQAPCRLTSPSGPRSYQLMADSLYLARADDDQQPYLQQIVFGPLSAVKAAPRSPAGADWTSSAPGTIRARLFVDDEDHRRGHVWQPKVKQRIARANQVLEYFCRMRIEIEGFDRWESDDQLKDFSEALTDFEKTASRGTADVAIGFTSQFPITQKMPHAGGTRGPLRSHILIREYGLQASEVERLEILLHELGHFLGAAHSPDRGSLMRTVLGDGQANLRSFRVTYDPYNVLAMNIVADQWRQRQARDVRQLDDQTRHRLAAIYGLMAQFYPQDQVALKLLGLMMRSPEYGALAVRDAVMQVARANQQRAAAGQKSYADDLLMAIYIRAAATVAAKLPPKYQAEAFLLGLGLSLDQQNLLSRFSPIARKLSLAESVQQREERLRVIGQPTVRGRVDLAQHFLATALLTLSVGASGAETAGLFKEVRDAYSGTGFSFADVAADLAGVQFATALQNDKLSLQQIRKKFRVADYVPDVAELEEGLSLDQLTDRYGALASPQFQAHLEHLRRQIRQLPGYGPTKPESPAEETPGG